MVSALEDRADRRLVVAGLGWLRFTSHRFAYLLAVS
jgi:hypothetical protein